MRRRRDQIDDRGTSVIILRDGKGEDGRKMVSIGCSSTTANALLASEAFACLAPGVPGQGSIAKSLGVERKRYHAHFRSHSLCYYFAAQSCVVLNRASSEA